MAHCPNCGGELKIIAAILEQPVIEKILTHLGLQADCGRRSALARGPAPQQGFALASATRPARPGAATRASPWVATASGLSASSQDVSGGPVPRAAGTGCASASQSRGLAADCKGKPQCDPLRETHFGAAIGLQPAAAGPKDRVGG